MQNKHNIKSYITSKFKEKFWGYNKLKEREKLRCYKVVLNPNLENKKYSSIFTTEKKKIKVAKIRNNSHELHSDTRCWPIPKTPWDKRVYHLCNTRRVQDKLHYVTFA